MKLEDLRKLADGASPGPWKSAPGWGEDEDTGVIQIASFGPTYQFLLGDEWWDDEADRPKDVLKEAEARAKANADQAFIDAFNPQTAKLLLDVVQAAQNCDDYLHPNHLNQIGCGSILHTKLKAALMALKAAP